MGIKPLGRACAENGKSPSIAEVMQIKTDIMEMGCFRKVDRAKISRTADLQLNFFQSHHQASPC